jgi:Protein of unknown function (DUF3151)
MPDDSDAGHPVSGPPVSFTQGPPETVLDPAPEDALGALAEALSLPAPEQKAALADVLAAHPGFLDGWAALAEHAARSDNTAGVVESYAYARVGYHRGLDSLRAAGWRGSGYVRWRHETNRGFLRSLEALRSAAGAIGETTESDRCRAFLHQLDPDWDRATADGLRTA